MEYYEFVCGGAPALFVATADPDPARLPAVALLCCKTWVFSGPFRLGDGSHSPAVDAAIKMRVESEGYHLYIKRPTS